MSQYLYIQHRKNAMKMLKENAQQYLSIDRLTKLNIWITFGSSMLHMKNGISLAKYNQLSF